MWSRLGWLVYIGGWVSSVCLAVLVGKADMDIRLPIQASGMEVPISQRCRRSHKLWGCSGGEERGTELDELGACNENTMLVYPSQTFDLARFEFF